MTTESAPAARTSAREAQHGSTLLHAPRRSARRRPVASSVSAAHGHRHLAVLLGSDAVTLAAALLLSPGATRPWWAVAPLVCVQLLLLAYGGLYRPRLSPSALAELPALAGLALLQWIATTEVFAAYGSGHDSGWPAAACAAALQALLVCGGRAGTYRLNRRQAARHPQSTLVVGDGPLAQRLTTALYERAEYGMRPVGQVGVTETPSAGLLTLPVLATAEDVSRAVVQADVRHAVFVRPHTGGPDPQELIALLTGYGCRLWAVEGPETAAVGPGASAGADHLWGFAVRPMTVPQNPVALAAKRALDVVLATVALVLAAPVLAACALAVRISDGPGVLFRQERVGLHGQPFVLLKFRTLRPADAHESATRWSVAHDRRMSPVGSLLRRSSLDELPQLWNVLRGDMSMVGPRPERPYFVTQFRQTYPGYQARHRVPVGITGLAQVNGLRGNTSIEDRARFDNHYIETWSLWQDVCILARTAASLFRFGGS
ncbi:sugar transferase [Streptomyces sp. NPDC058657]|uniref:sugar transferase n=1 Tax=unclassified Streptomyces TaxID=2593676 RepID=UPI00365CCB40